LLKWGLSGRGSNLLKSDPPLTYVYDPRVVPGRGPEINCIPGAI
jgi:hypothetical protein